LYRKITHSEYKGIKKIGDKGPQSWLPKVISQLDDVVYKGRMGYEIVNDEFIKKSPNAHILPQIGGGVALLAIVLYTYFSIKEDSFGEGFDLFLYFFSWSILIFFIIYYYTMPKKEIIFNRMEGTVTFPGWMWNKNITMPFDKIKFSYTTGGPNMIGAYQLQLVRPDKAGSILFFPFGAMDCYQELSIITWYMDKNRPSPPHKDFDPYREKDFQRRKKKKFPKPLYRSRIPTPEATPEQQAERERYWKG
jgi:hypothetical protein